MGERVCTRCKRWAAQSGDSWCAACTATEAVHNEWGKTWQPGYRRIAQDLIISAARQIRALRVASGVQSVVSQQVASERQHRKPTPAVTPAGLEVSELHDKASSDDPRGDLPRRRTTQVKASPRPVPKQPVREPSSSGSDEDEEEDRDEKDDREKTTPPPPDPGHQPLPGGRKDPPGPDQGAGDQSKRKRESPRRSEKRLDNQSVAHSGREKKPHKHKDRRRRPRHRAGRKHQRLHRLLKDPSQILHHKPGESFFALQEDWRSEESLH